MHSQSVIGKETTSQCNVAMHGDYDAGVQIAMAMLTGTPLSTIMLRFALKKVKGVRSFGSNF